MRSVNLLSVFVDIAFPVSESSYVESRDENRKYNRIPELLEYIMQFTEILFQSIVGMSDLKITRKFKIS